MTCIFCRQNFHFNTNLPSDDCNCGENADVRGLRGLWEYGGLDAVQFAIRCRVCDWLNRLIEIIYGEGY